MEKDKITEALGNLMEALVEQSSKERRESEPYKDMFSKARTESIEAVLRDAEHKMTGIALDVAEVIEQKYGKNVNKLQWEILLALPFVENKLAKHLSDTEGFACSVDKVYYILDKIFLDK